MTNIILLNESDNIIYRFKKMALKTLRAEEKKLFQKHFDPYIEWLGEEKKDFAEAIKTLSRDGGPIIVRNMLDMFKIREEEQNAEMGMPTDDNDGDGERNAALPGLCSGGSESGDGYSESAGAPAL